MRRHQRSVRNNVDVIVADVAERRRWLRATPDTYRVRQLPTSLDPDVIIVGETDDPEEIAAEKVLVLGSASAGLAAVVVNSDADAAIGATTRPPPPWRRGIEPPITPQAIAVIGDAWREVGGAPPGPGRLHILVDRLRASGRLYAMLPTDGPLGPSGRTDAIDRPCVVIVSGVPMHDVGGGSRPAQLAMELASSGVHVVFVSVFASDESVDLGLRFIHPNLEQVRASDLDPGVLARRIEASTRLVIAATPAPPVLPIVDALAGAGFNLVYDLIDDWSRPPLGEGWYRLPAEERLVAQADAVVAATPALVQRIGSYGAEALLVPNGVNAALFSRPIGPRPSDLPEGDRPVIGYHGSLHGHWIDWEALAAVASANTEANVVIIGDTGGGVPSLPDNVRFIGMKPQMDLPDYLARFDAGLIPFEVSDASRAASPLKAYEYLASGVTVAAPHLPALDGLAGVYTNDDLVRAVHQALAAPRPDPALILDSHSWRQRATQILGTVGVDLPAAEGPAVLTVSRPIVHYAASDR